jgi:hypothetical protein
MELMMKTTRLCLLFAMAIAAMFTGDARPTPADRMELNSVAATHPLHAARLRKLHLVRPDLINYPLSFDVVC